MRVIRIDETKLKVILTSEDVEKYKLSDISEENGGVSYAALRKIIEDCGGIGCSPERTVVRYFSSRDGGAEMYITKYSTLSDEAEEAGADMARHKKEQRSVKKYAYSIGSVSDLLRAALPLSRLSKIASSSLYYDGVRDLFYLYIESESDVSGVLSEFGESVYFSGVYTYIEERCRCIISGDAVAKLSYITDKS